MFRKGDRLLHTKEVFNRIYIFHYWGVGNKDGCIKLQATRKGDGTTFLAWDRAVNYERVETPIFTMSMEMEVGE